MNEQDEKFLGLTWSQVLIIGGFTLYEIFIDVKLQQQLSQTDLHPVIEFLVYNLGDFNNSFLVSHILFFLFKKIDTLKEIASQQNLLDMAVFLTFSGLVLIEINDLADLPAALLGALVYWLMTEVD